MSSSNSGDLKPDAAPSAPPMKCGAPEKNVMAFQMIDTSDKRRMYSFVVSKAFAYYTLAVGIGLLIMGSVLTYICSDPVQRRDPFHRNLQVAAIMFLVIGILLIFSNILRCFSFSCCEQEKSETEVKPIPFSCENTILYNPHYPPILVPYTTNTSTQFDENDVRSNYPVAIPGGNFPFLPGSLIFGEENRQVVKSDEPGEARYLEKERRSQSVNGTSSSRKVTIENNPIISQATADVGNPSFILPKF